MIFSPLRVFVLLLVFCGSLVLTARADRAGQDMVRESDAALNRAYQHALASMKSPGAKAKLKEAQRAWIAFRDAEAAMMDELTHTPLDMEEHVAEMNTQRAKQLQALPADDGEAADDAVATDEDSTPLARDYKVRCQVGLVVHATPDAKGKRIGTLEDGQKIQLDGKKAPGSGNVFPIVSKDKGEMEGATWIRIKAPLEGYVLFQADGTPANDYIVPQILSE